MKDEQLHVEQENLPYSGIFQRLLWSIGVPVFVVLASLLLEYKSGYFQQIGKVSNPASANIGSVLFLGGTLLVIMFLTWNGLTIFISQYRYFREQWALLLFCLASSLTILMVFSILGGLMPWSVPDCIVDIVANVSLPRSELREVDVVLLLTLYMLCLIALGRLNKSWRGLKSTEQYHREQRGVEPNFLIEGYSELRRIVKRQPPLRIHSEASSRDFTLQLEPVTDTLIWKDQAKELIRLSSTSYAFDSSTGWHDKQNCWVGKNVDSGDLVFLLPFQETGKDQINSFLEYARRVSINESKRIGEIIVASKGKSIERVDTIDNLSIRYETETSLLNKLVDFKDYFNEIRRRVLVESLPDSELTLNDVYVPSKFLLPNGSEHDSSIEEYLTHWLNETGQRQLALLGEYGQGKSTATLMWAYHLIQVDSMLGRQVPLLIELRGTSPRNLPPLQLLGAWSAQYNINAQALMRLHIAGQLVLIFEGFDEMSLVGDAEMRLKHFRTLWQFAYPKAKILITGRPNFFLDEEEMKAALGISKPITARPFCEALRLSLFDADQINEALRAHQPTVRMQIHSLVMRNSRFLELVSRPSLLHIVAVLWERERLSEKVDQLTSAYVMDLFIRHSYRRQGVKELDSPEFMALTSMEREYFMSGIASYMAAEALPNQISSTQLNDLISVLIDVIPDQVSTESTALSGESSQPLRQRVIGTEYGIEHVKTDVRACGILVDDPSAPGTFRFAHKSFMEYLFAETAAEYIRDVESAKAAAVFRSTGASIENLLGLPVAIEFLSEIVVDSASDTVIDEVTKDVTVAKRLFKTIFGDRAKHVSLWQKLGPSIQVVIYTLTRQASPIKRLIARFLILSLPSIIIFVVGLYFLRILSFYKMRPTIHLILPMVLSFAAVTSAVMMFFIFLSPVGYMRKLSLWTQLCKKMGVHDRILHLVLGTHWIPWVREQRIDYQMSYFSSEEPKHDP